MINITDKALCCGCGACAQVCPVGCIGLKDDGEGFLYPAVDANKCVDCGRCEQVCPIRRADEGRAVDTRPSPDPYAVGGWHRDAAIRQASSSGGAFSLLANDILARGGAVYGAAMNGPRAEHVRAEDEQGMARMRGSKYVQSATRDSYSQIKADLKAGKPVLFSGTPCQTAGLLSYLGKRDENLYTVDFICHGVPSPKVFEAYYHSQEAKANAKIVAFSFREKDKGWHPSGLQLGTRMKFDDGTEVRKYPALKDSYMNGFLEDIYLRPCCYECRFKVIPKWSADITIADFWGVDKALPEMNDGKGTSLMLIHNEHGRALFDAVKQNFDYRECDWHDAIRKNPTLIHSAKPTPLRQRFFKDFEAKGYDGVAGKYMSTPKTVVRKASKIAGKTVDGILKKLVGIAAKLLHVKQPEVFEEKALQFIKFCMVGVSNVIVSYTVNILTLFLLSKIAPGMQYDYMVANVTAFLVSVYWSFFWNSRKVFHLDTDDKALRRKALFRSYLCYGFTGIILNNLLSTLWIKGLGISKLVAPLINLIVTIPTNYLTNKKFAFGVGKKA